MRYTDVQTHFTAFVTAVHAIAVELHLEHAFAGFEVVTVGTHINEKVAIALVSRVCFSVKVMQIAVYNFLGIGTGFFPSIGINRITGLPDIGTRQ